MTTIPDDAEFISSQDASRDDPTCHLRLGPPYGPELCGDGVESVAVCGHVVNWDWTPRDRENLCPHCPWDEVEISESLDRETL